MASTVDRACPLVVGDRIDTSEVSVGVKFGTVRRCMQFTILLIFGNLVHSSCGLGN